MLSNQGSVPIPTKPVQISLWWLVAGVAGGLFLCAVYGFLIGPKPIPAQSVKQGFMQDIDGLDSAVSQLQQAINSRKSASVIQHAFKQARLAYKKTEFITAYYNPETTRALNGPNIPEVDDDLRINAPEGFQVLEERLFPIVNSDDYDETRQQAALLRSNVNRLRKISESNELTDSHIFDAMRLEVFRVISLGITGFDSPVASHSLPEAATALERLQQQLACYNLSFYDAGLADQLDQTFTKSIRVLRSARNVDAFDRLLFIRDHANVLSRLLLDAQHVLAIPVFTEKRLLSPAARTLTDTGVFNANFFVNLDEQRPTPDRVALGRLLFVNPVLSGSGKRSCASCHQPEKAFTDGEKTSLALNTDSRSSNGARTLRNAPTLLNAALQAAQFADSRVVFLEDQASDVIQNQQEMHGSLPKAVNALQQDATYRTLFAKAYKEGITEQSLKNAIASYIRSLTSLNSRMDAYFRGQPNALTAEEKYGFNLFMGKGKCATCHFFPLFNGTVPPAFQETESEVLGTPATTKAIVVDPDEGKFRLTQRAPHRYAFKTPTVRHVAKTAPYMHNGVFRTLEEVVEFYDKGGGNGLGFNLPNQTLPFDKLNLTPREKKALVTFMKVL